MKNFYTFFFTAILTFMLTENLSAMSIGRDGASYFENDIEWQKVSYENDDVGFIALIPGSPKSGIAGENVFTYSKYQDVDYEIHCSLNERYIPPENEKMFIQQIENAFSNNVIISSIQSNQRKVKYIAEIYFYEKNKIARVYCSQNYLYWMLVQGKDLSIAPLFFEAIEITK